MTTRSVSQNSFWLKRSSLTEAAAVAKQLLAEYPFGPTSFWRERFFFPGKQFSRGGGGWWRRRWWWWRGGKLGWWVGAVARGGEGVGGDVGGDVGGMVVVEERCVNGCVGGVAG